jgi:hypothetical protein
MAKVQNCEKVEQRTQHQRTFVGRTFFSRIIMGERGFAAASGYIVGNPAKAKLVKEAKEWKFGRLFHKLRGYSDLLAGCRRAGCFSRQTVRYPLHPDNGARHCCTPFTNCESILAQRANLRFGGVWPRLRIST